MEEESKMVAVLEKKMEEVKLEEKLREDEDFIRESETEGVPVLDGEASIKNKKKKKKKKGKSKVCQLKANNPKSLILSTRHLAVQTPY